MTAVRAFRGSSVYDLLFSYGALDRIGIRGRGARREVASTGGLTKMREGFFGRNEGRSYPFYVNESSLSISRRFVVNYLLAPDGEGTLFTWTLALEPKLALRLPFKTLAPSGKRGSAGYPPRARNLSPPAKVGT